MGVHAPQVTTQNDSVSLFSLDPERKQIRRHGERLAIGDDEYAAEDLAKKAAAQPGAFSPNVLTRPIVQDALFPTICYVAGPSELAYLGQLRGVYEHFGVPMPLMFSRATATLLDSGATRFLAKYGVAFEDLRKPDESTLNRRRPRSARWSTSCARCTRKSFMRRRSGTTPFTVSSPARRRRRFRRAIRRNGSSR